MYSSLYLLYIVIGKINTILVTLCVLSGIIAFIFFIWHINHYSERCSISDRKASYNLPSDEDNGDIVMLRKIRYWLYRCIIAFSILISVSTLMPSGEQVVTYKALSAVDDYAKNNPGSVASPNFIFKTADDVSKLFTKMVKVSENVLGTVEKSTELANKKLDRVNKKLDKNFITKDEKR